MGESGDNRARIQIHTQKDLETKSCRGRQVQLILVFYTPCGAPFSVITRERPQETIRRTWPSFLEKKLGALFMAFSAGP